MLTGAMKAGTDMLALMALTRTPLSKTLIEPFSRSIATAR